MKYEYDLHCHSTVSDGIFSPEEIVSRAASNGIKVLALTDHDNTDGVGTAQKAAGKYGIKLICGVEVSATWLGHTIHITGLDIDYKNQKLQKILKGIQEYRTWRGEEIGRRLERHSIKNAYKETMKLVKGNLLTRTHYAEFLYNSKLVKTRQAAFDKYLLSGKPGHVKGKWPGIAEVVPAIHGAGGLACIAHPQRYKMTNTKLNRLFIYFKKQGGDAMEVVNSTSSQDQINHMARLSLDYNFFAAVGSDFHYPNQWIELGKLKPLPKECSPIWEQFA